MASTNEPIFHYFLSLSQCIRNYSWLLESDFWLFSELRGGHWGSAGLWQPTSLMFTKERSWLSMQCLNLCSYYNISDFGMFNLQFLVCWWFNYGGRWVQHVQYALNRALKGKYFRNATAYGNQVPEQCLNDLGTNISISRILRSIYKGPRYRCTVYTVYTYIYLISYI